MPGPTATASAPRPPRRPGRTAFILTVALLASPVAASADDKAAPPPAKSGGNSVGDSIHSLGQQISDPKTLDRIKGHEQEFEKNVQATRDQQRKSHPGELRARDATDMATDPQMGGQGATKGAPKPKTSAAKNKKAQDATVAPAQTAKAPPKAPPPATAPPVK